jgi:flagellar protein FliO/FliZ
MVELVLRIVFSLLVVLGLLWALARIARRPLAGRGGGTVTVLARQQLTRGAAVAVVRVADRALILGVTDGQVSLLGETDPATLGQSAAGEPIARRESVPLSSTPQRGGLDGSALSPRTWSQTVQFLREWTARR